MTVHVSVIILRRSLRLISRGGSSLKILGEGIAPISPFIDGIDEASHVDAMAVTRSACWCRFVFVQESL